MIKIIKYSIVVIIFSIIASLFGLYFYLLKGISISNLNYQNIKLEKLYIKIDKKIILKAKNIYIISKKSKNTNKNINFKETTKLVKNILQYFSFFQEINIQNLNINKNKINLISFYKDKISVDTDEIFLQASLYPDKKRTIIKISELNIKPADIIIHNITGKFYADLTHLYVNIDTIYKKAQLYLDLTITNKNISYKGKIYNITNKIIEKYKLPISLYAYSIKFEGDTKLVKFNIENIKTTIKNNLITSPLITGYFDIKTKKAHINNHLLTLLTNGYKINILDTNVDYELATNNSYINNKQIILKDYNLTLNNNHIVYSPNKTDIKIDNLKLNYLANVTSNNIHVTYSKDININIPTTNIKYQNFNIDIKNINALYSNNIINSTIPYINITSKDLSAQLYKNNINYNLNTKQGKISINNIKANYKSLKNIQINKIYTNIDNKIIKNNIASLKINTISLNNINTLFKNNIISTEFTTNTLLSKKLNNILSVFGINISIYQKTGKNDIKGKIIYNLKNSKLNTNLKIKVDNSKLMLTKTTFLDIKHSELELQDTNITLNNTTLDYNQSIVNLDYHINKGLINLNKSYIKTDGKFNDLNITNIVEIKNYPEKLYIDLNGIDIFLKNLKTSVLIHKDIIVNIDKLSKFYPYISYLKEYNLNEGKIKVIIGDDIKILTNITDTNQTILEQNLTPITKLDINTTIKDNNITILNPNLRINILNEKNLTKIDGGYKNLDINVSQFVDKNTSEDNKTTNLSTKILANNTYIIYHNTKIYSDKLSIFYSQKDKNKTAKVVSLYKDRNITILYNNGALKLYGLKIREKTFKELTNTNFLRDPFVTLFVLKNKDSQILQGFVEIKSGYIKELKALTNVLAFINLIPSLVTFQPVGFTSKGYKIKNGYIEYILYNDILYFKTISITGENLTFNGNGYVDLKHKKIKMNVDVNLIVKLIKDIPIVNYILLGKDGGITIKITIDGPLDNPKVHKNTASNIIEAPIGIIKRALLTPFRPFMKEDK